MSRYHSYLNTSTEIVSRYTGDQPLAGFLKVFFAGSKKYGSNDRKQISHLCYCYYRTGKMFTGTSLTDKESLAACILAGLFLCSTTPNEILQQLQPRWNEQVHLSVGEKCEWLKKYLQVENAGLASQLRAVLPENLSPQLVFPWKAELSDGADHLLYSQSFFRQPDLFIRIRPEARASVQEKLEISGIPHRIINEHCVSFLNNTRLDSVIIPDQEAVIQDYSSQQVASFLQMVPVTQKITIWDCCAASGGKTILAKDILKNVDITVSDIRESALFNLRKRFAAAGINDYKSRVMDLTQPPIAAPQALFDLIICDVPCSGSGTWARTPEQLYFWKQEEILQYSTTQKKILTHVVPALKKGGYLLYVTCSVFKEENENIVNNFLQQHNLKLMKMELLKGYDKKADTLFAAIFFNAPA